MLKWKEKQHKHTQFVNIDIFMQKFFKPNTNI